jgi:hypothetical protein
MMFWAGEIVTEPEKDLSPVGQALLVKGQRAV